MNAHSIKQSCEVPRGATGVVSQLEEHRKGYASWALNTGGDAPGPLTLILIPHSYAKPAREMLRLMCPNGRGCHSHDMCCAQTTWPAGGSDMSPF